MTSKQLSDRLGPINPFENDVSKLKNGQLWLFPCLWLVGAYDCIGTGCPGAGDAGQSNSPAVWGNESSENDETHTNHSYGATLFILQNQTRLKQWSFLQALIISLVVKSVITSDLCSVPSFAVDFLYNINQNSLEPFTWLKSIQKCYHNFIEKAKMWLNNRK